MTCPPSPTPRPPPDADALDEAYRLGLGVDDARLACFRTLFEEGGTRCGMPSAAQLALLAPERGAAIGSAALIPLVHEEALGVIMLSSRDESRFGAGKGVVFLDQLGEVLSRRLHALARAEKGALATTREPA